MLNSDLCRLESDRQYEEFGRPDFCYDYINAHSSLRATPSLGTKTLLYVVQMKNN